MPPNKVETVTRFFQAAERFFEAYWKNPRSLAVMLETDDLFPEAREVLNLLHPDVEWNSVAFAFIGGAARGHLEWMKGWDQLLSEDVEDYRVTVRELVDLGDDQVLATVGRDLKAKGTGIELTAPLFAVLTLRDGLIVRFDEYTDRQEALNTATRPE